MKKISKFFLILMTFLSCFAALSLDVHGAEAQTLVIHYYRYEGDYAGWSLWLWQAAPINGEGERFSFEGDDAYGKTLTVDLTGTILEGATSVGFLVSTASWTKDVAVDRFIDMSNPDENGAVHVWLIQSDENMYYVEGEADTSDRIFWTHFTDENTIAFKTTRPVTVDDVTLFVDEVDTVFSNFMVDETLGSFDIAQDADLHSSYVLSVDLGGAEPATLSVGFDGIFDSPAFEEAFGYDGTLGAIYTPTATTFKVWAPISKTVSLNLYSAGHTADQTDNDGLAGVDDPEQTAPLVLGDKGVWSVTVDGDLNGLYYTYTVNNGGMDYEVVDPYALAAGVNGDRGMVIDFTRYEPDGWDADERPDTMEAYTDAIIYELHVRDLTSSDTWNGTEAYRGKFLGLVEKGTTYAGLTTGMDHLVELGITHVQLLPVFDSGVIDETRLDDPTYYGISDGIFNWGYMPENYNVVEGSYSTDPYHGEVRVLEFKEMVQSFHQDGIRVIMDVVYNHTGKSADSNFNLIVPGYYYRMSADGSFSNGSGTGNETASERVMFQKFIVDSVLFWVNEYHIDGFRFDLMKLHDVETMNLVSQAVHAVDPTIMIYGEPWTGGTSPLDESLAAFNDTLDQMPGIAVFNDDTRDGIKGSVFDVVSPGFTQGYRFYDTRVLFGITGGTLQAGIKVIQLPKGAWAQEPVQCINYVECHDNNTLYDKLRLSSDADAAGILRMHKQAYAMIFLSQGISFMQGGSEFLRSKPCPGGGNTCDADSRFDKNSYRSPDGSNQIDWSLKETNLETYEYFQKLIAIRKAKAVFTLATSAEIAERLEITEDETSGYVSYFLDEPTDLWSSIFIAHNGGDRPTTITIPEGTWNVVLTSDEIGDSVVREFDGESVFDIEALEVLAGGASLELQPNDSYMMVRINAAFTPDVDKPALTGWEIAGIVAGSTVFLAGLAVLILRKKIFHI